MEKNNININKLKTFVGGIGEQITEKAGSAVGMVRGKAEYVLDVVRDKAGKAVGMVRDKAGNLVEIVTENLPAVAKTVALSGLIMIAGVMSGCDLGTGNTPGTGKGNGNENTEQNQNTEDEKNWTTYNKELLPVGPIYAGNITADSTPLTAENILTSAATSVAYNVGNMATNIKIYNNGRDYHKVTKGMPDPDFLDKIINFNSGGFGHGHDGMTQYNQTRFADMTDLIANLDGMVKEEDRELFKKLIAAYRGLNFIQARDQSQGSGDYTAPISLSAGTQTNIGDLLQDVNGSNGEREDYSLTGNYPTAAKMREDIFSLLPASPDNAHPGLVKDVITTMGNFEQLYGVLTRAYTVGQKYELSTEAVNAIRNVVNQVRETIRIDQPEYLQKLTANYLIGQQSQMGQ